MFIIHVSGLLLMTFWPMMEKVWETQGGDYAKKQTSFGHNQWEYFGRYLSYVPPTGRVCHKAFLGGSEGRAVAQTRPVAPEMSRAPSAFPEKETLKVPGDKTCPSKES